MNHSELSIFLFIRGLIMTRIKNFEILLMIKSSIIWTSSNLNNHLIIMIALSILFIKIRIQFI